MDVFTNAPAVHWEKCADKKVDEMDVAAISLVPLPPTTVLEQNGTKDFPRTTQDRGSTGPVWEGNCQIDMNGDGNKEDVKVLRWISNEAWPGKGAFATWNDKGTEYFLWVTLGQGLV